MNGKNAPRYPFLRKALPALMVLLTLLSPLSAAQKRRKHAPPKAVDDSTFMPVDNQAPGWARSGATKAFGPGELYGFMDGGAELFLEFGFEKLYYQAFAQKTEEITVELYRMTDPAAALGIYLSKCGKETRDASFSERHNINRYQLTAVKNKWFLVIGNTDGKPERMADMVRLGRAVMAKAPPNVPVKELFGLTAKQLVPGSVRLIRGPYALQPIATLGEGDILSLGKKLTAVAGSYPQAGGESYYSIMVDYPTPDEAKKAFVYLKDHLDSYLKVQKTTDASLTYKDASGKFGKAALGGARMSISVNLKEAPQD